MVARVRDLQVYEDAELQRKNLEARLSVLASGDVQMLSGGPSEGDGEPRRTGELGSLSGGNIIQIPTGMTTTVVEPKAAPGYTDYVKWQLHLIAAGFGVTYEMMTGDVREVNFSSARVRRLDFVREVEMLQWTLLIPRLCDRICKAFADACVLGGIVNEQNHKVEHATPKWDYVNPHQDVRADLDEISGGLSSISEKLRRRGYKPEAVFAELASDVKTLDKLGLLDFMMMMQKGRQMSDGQSDEAPAQAAAQK